jgi:hypothetical protein
MKRLCRKLFCVLIALVLTNTGFGQVKLNEIFSRGVPGALDWIEIYNSSAASVDVSGFKIYDVGGQTGTKAKKPFPSGIQIAAGGYYVIIVDTNSAGLNDGFGLSNNGETVWLENATGTLIDSVAFPALGVDTSYARKPDGAATWTKISPVTRGSTNGANTGVDQESGMVSGFALLQNFPNPCNPATTITYQVLERSEVRLTIFDILGKEVITLVNATQPAGQYAIPFNAERLSSGVYFYTLTAGSFRATKSLTVLK